MGNPSEARQKRLTNALQLIECPECGGKHLIRDHNCAEVVCADCGLVLTEREVDRGPEWRAFNIEQRAQRSRVGGRATFTIHDKGLTTTIGRQNRDASGRILAPRRKALFQRIRRWQRRARLSGSEERNLVAALTAMSKICDSTRVPANVVETASLLYRKALKHRLIRGRSVRGVVAACVYIACRQCCVARNLDEVAHASGMGRKKVGRVYRFLRKKLREQVPQLYPTQYVSRFTSRLDIGVRTETLVLRLIRKAKQARLTLGKAPLSICAAAMYIASILMADKRTQREIAYATGITEVTLRNLYKDLIKRMEITIKL